MCISKLKNGDILTKKMEIVSYIGNFIFLIMIIFKFITVTNNYWIYFSTLFILLTLRIIIYMRKKMKKFKIFLSLILALTITLKISTVVNADDTQTIESFEELKEIINKNLNINNNHYVYSQEQKENIKNAVYSFDINSY